MHNIGMRLKCFRQRSGMSQMDLELATDCAFGSISRFEAGKVNPTKETIEYIGQALELSDMEMDYLVGSEALPASSKEIGMAIQEVEQHFKRKGVFAYLIDERMRIHWYSDTLARILGLPLTSESNTCNSILDKTLIEVMLSSKFPIRKFLDRADNNYNLRVMLKCYYYEIGYMTDDPYFQSTLKEILGDEEAKRIWGELSTNTCRMTIIPNEERKGYFNIGGMRFELCFTNQNLHQHKRFKMVEYIPNNALINLISKGLNNK